MSTQKYRNSCLVKHLLLIFLASCTPATSLPTEAPPRMSPSLPIGGSINLGVVFQGESAAIKCWARNTGTRAIDIKEISKSCDCTSVRLSNRHLEPGEKTLVALTYDGAKEPTFVGSLSIDIIFLSGEQKKVGALEVAVEIVPAKRLFTIQQ